MIESLGYAKLDASLEHKMIKYQDKHKSIIKNIAKICNVSGFDCLGVVSPKMRLAVMLELANKCKAQYTELGISDKIYNDTMSDIGVWCRNNKNKGLKEYNWIKNHVSFQLFKIGRLQYQFYTITKFEADNSKGIKAGDKVIYVHIPQGASLRYEACCHSIKMANEFFNKYFSNYDYKYFYSQSWLLYDKNKDFMDKNSNIIKFDSLFDIVSYNENENQAIERIFGKKRKTEKYPEKTSLQKKAKAYLISGHKLGMGTGIISKEKIIHISETSK